MDIQPAIICPPDLSQRPLVARVEQFVKLPVEKIYKAWTTQLDLWFASPGSYLYTAEANKPFYFETSFEAVRHPHYGRVLRLEEPSLVEITWVTAGTHGAETVLTISLSPQQEGTLIQLVHAGFSSTSSRDDHQASWPYILVQLEDRMSKPVD
jgi:uncharacterized protein YndB with AHSA1/START domain